MAPYFGFVRFVSMPSWSSYLLHAVSFVCCSITSLSGQSSITLDHRPIVYMGVPVAVNWNTPTCESDSTFLLSSDGEIYHKNDKTYWIPGFERKQLYLIKIVQADTQFVDTSKFRIQFLTTDQLEVQGRCLKSLGICSGPCGAMPFEGLKPVFKNIEDHFDLEKVLRIDSFKVDV